MSYLGMEQLKRGKIPEALKEVEGPPSRQQFRRAAGIKYSAPEAEDLNRFEQAHRHQSLTQNMAMVVQKSEVTSRQIKELVEILRIINGGGGLKSTDASGRKGAPSI